MKNVLTKLRQILRKGQSMSLKTKRETKVLALRIVISLGWTENISMSSYKVAHTRSLHMPIESNFDWIWVT